MLNVIYVLKKYCDCSLNMYVATSALPKYDIDMNEILKVVILLYYFNYYY